MYQQAVRAAQGYTPGQEGVWGVWPTATFPGMITADSRIIYVDPNHPLAVDNGNVGLDPTSPFLTIQAALAQTRDNRGDVILVGHNDGWQYGEANDPRIQETVTVNTHGVRLVGVGPSPLGVYWSPAATTNFALTINAMDVHVEGFAFTNSTSGFANANGIYAEWDGTTLWGENVSIWRCFFDEDIDIGIQLEFAWNNEIAYCSFQECEDSGIYVDPAGSGIAYSSIHDCWFQDISGGTSAMALRGAEDMQIFRNTIFNGTAQGAGVATDEGIDTTGGGDNMVFDNFFSCLLPVPANGDWDDLNTSAATDAWINNHCINGPNTTRPT